MIVSSRLTDTSDSLTHRSGDNWHVKWIRVDAFEVEREMDSEPFPTEARAASERTEAEGGPMGRPEKK